MELWKSFKARVDDDDESEDEIKTAFQSYDIDGDGYITKDEMVKVRRIDLSSVHIVAFYQVGCCISDS